MSTPKTWYVPRTQITPDPNNPRRTFNDMDGLVASIQSRGIVSPITLRPSVPEDKVATPYVIVAGERRYRAAGIAGIEEVPCVMLPEVSVGTRRLTASTAEHTTLEVTATAELALIENIQRSDLTPMEEAAAFKQLLDNDKESNAGILASRLGLTTDYVKKRLTLNALPEAVQDEVNKRNLPLSHALCLHALVESVSADEIVKLALLASRKAWPLRKVEMAVSKLQKTEPRARFARGAPAAPVAAPVTWDKVVLPTLGKEVGAMKTVVTPDGVTGFVVVHTNPATLLRLRQAVRTELAAIEAEASNDV